jgi:hypothetical protein
MSRSALEPAGGSTENDYMPDVVDRYRNADAAFAVYDSEAAPDGSRIEEEWAAYLEWADATAAYVQHLANLEREGRQIVPALAEIRHVLCSQRLAAVPTQPLVSIFTAGAVPEPAHH